MRSHLSAYADLYAWHGLPAVSASVPPAESHDIRPVAPPVLQLSARPLLSTDTQLRPSAPRSAYRYAQPSTLARPALQLDPSSTRLQLGPPFSAAPQLGASSALLALQLRPPSSSARLARSSAQHRTLSSSIRTPSSGHTQLNTPSVRHAFRVAQPQLTLQIGSPSQLRMPPTRRDLSTPRCSLARLQLDVPHVASILSQHLARGARTPGTSGPSLSIDLRHAGTIEQRAAAAI